MTATRPGTTGPIDLYDPELIRAPMEAYARIREIVPLPRAVMPGVDPAWIVTRFDDVTTVLTDPRFVNDKANIPGMDVPHLREQVLRAHEIPEEYMKYRLYRMDAFDGAEHTRLRSLVTQAFTARRVRSLRPRVEQIAERLLDRVEEIAEDDVVDMVAEFANLMPPAVMSELVGIPEEDRELWDTWYASVSPSVDAETKAAAWEALVPYARALVERRRAEPSDDLISALIQAQDEDGGRLSDDEMIAMMVMLGLTGPHTNTTFIGNGILALLTHPEQRALLWRNPGLMPRAVHELLRWCPPTWIVPRMRFATEDVEIGGTTIRKGEAVWVIVGGANHDPDRFPDAHRLDFTRDTGGRAENHVAFGQGAHHCLAAVQARQDAEVAFAAVLRRFPEMEPAADPAELTYEPMPFQWRLTRLPVRLRPERRPS